MQANIHGESILKGKPLQLIDPCRGATTLRPMSDRAERQGLAERGYAFVPGDDFALGARQAADLASLADEWNRLEPDNYLRNEASFRERR